LIQQRPRLSAYQPRADLFLSILAYVSRDDIYDVIGATGLQMVISGCCFSWKVGRRIWVLDLRCKFVGVVQRARLVHCTSCETTYHYYVRRAKEFQRSRASFIYPTDKLLCISDPSRAMMCSDPAVLIANLQVFHTELYIPSIQYEPKGSNRRSDAIILCHPSNPQFPIFSNPASPIAFQIKQKSMCWVGNQFTQKTGKSCNA